MISKSSKSSQDKGWTILGWGGGGGWIIAFALVFVAGVGCGDDGAKSTDRTDAGEDNGGNVGHCESCCSFLLVVMVDGAVVWR